MKIAFNPSTVAALTTPPNNKDITFDLRGRNIFARGVKFYGTDTNTWRDIKINNVSIGSHTLDLQNGSNTTLTNTNGVVTINSTWRPVVDNLTSDSTTSSLSAKQGKVLKALIDGKSNSDHNHDGRYVRYYAVTTLDCNNLAAGLTSARISATNAAHPNHSAYLYISDVGTPFQIQIPDSSIPYIYKRYYGSGKWSGWFKLNAGYADSAGSVAWANVTGKPSSYTPSAHTHAWNSLTHSSTTENQAILTNGKANGWKLQTLNIARWDNAANNAHSHANKSVLDGITSALVNSWNTAYNFVSNITGTDTDKVINKWEEIVNFLAGITEDNKLNTLLNSKLSVYELADNTNVGTIKNNGIYYSTTDASSRTLINSPFNTGFAFINMTSYDGGDDLRRSRLAFNAFGEIKVSDDSDQANTAETWYNVLTSKNSGINGSTIKLNGTSITVYSSGTADGRYVKKSGDTMSGVLTIDTPNFGALTIKRNDDDDGASIQFRGKSSVYGYIGLNNSTKDKQFLRWSSDISRIYTILDTSSTYISNGKGVINGTTITQVDNATNSTNSTNARKLVNWYSARPTSLNAQFGDGSLRIFYATSSTTEGKPAEDSHILHLAWDNTGGYDAQLAVHARSGKVSTRAQNGGTWQPWKTLAFTTDIPSSLKNPYSFNVFGVVYDGSAAKTVTTSTFISQVTEGTSTITDGTMLITSYATNSGFADTNAVNVPYKRKAIHLWEYIKAKTDSLYATKGHNHDDRYYTKAESNVKYITDITTSVNKLTFTRNGSNIIRDITVNIVYSQGNLTNISNKDNTTKASSGLYIYNSYNQVIGTNSYSSVLSINTGGTIQIAGDWGDDQTRNLYWRSQSDRNVADYPWKSWRTILDSENYSSTLDSRYYTESEVNSLLDAKLNRQNLSYGNWNPRGYHLAADYHYNGGDLSISENNGKMYVSVDGCFWQNEGQYRVLDTSDIGDIQGSVTLHQYLGATDVARYPLIWGGDYHNNTSDSTGAVYKSYDKLSWQTSSQTLYATNIQTNNIKNLSIEGGIYWNPYVESASDNTDAASITLVRQGVAGGTTLVLSQMNDTNDTIQFKTNTAARLYHNSYPILTTQNTYVSNNKGYINGLEITQVNYADSAGSVAWNNVTGKPSAFNPADHTHTVFKNNLMIKGTNGMSDSASIHLGIGDSDTGFKWISDGVCQIYANNEAVGQWTSGGMNWFKNPTVNGNKVWNAGNDGSGSGLDADTVDGYHAASFVKMYTGKFTQYNKGTWTKILQFTIPSGHLEPTISFIWHPTECARDVWADFNINIRSGSPIFYVNWKGTTRRTVYCVGDGTTYSVWVQGTKFQWDPYGLVQVISTWQINTYQAGSLQYSDSEPTGTYKVVASMSGIIMYADRLLTARKINGTSFDGTSDITTAYWGTTRTISLTGAITGSVSTNGGDNITINTTYGTGNITNLDNRYVKKAGDTMQGNLNFTSGKQTRWTAYGISYITDGNIDSGTSLGGNLANLVISSWNGVSFTTSCSGQTYTNKTAVGINCRTGIVYAANFVGPLQGNAATATKLQTSRSIWGQSFDGTRDVSGTLSGVANIQFSADGAYDIGSNSATSRYIYTHWLGAKSGSKLELGANNSGFGQGLCIDTNLNVGIGTNSPIQKLDVIGNIRATGQLYLPTNGNYNGILIGDDCWIGDCDIGNVIGLSGVADANSGGIKFGKGGMFIGYNGSSHYSSGTSLWTNFNADTVDGEHASNFSYTHQSSFDFSKRKSGRIVTFDQSGTDYGWINGFASTHNNYLTSVIFNAHRSSNWYVGYMEGDMSTGETNGLQAVHKLAFADGDDSYPIFLGYLNLFNGNDGTISSSFPCLGYSVPFTYTRGGPYCFINIPNTSFQTFYIKAAIASVHYSGAGMDYWVGNHRGEGSWWLHCYAAGSNAVQVKGFHPANRDNDSWWGGNPLYSGNGAAKAITVCLFGHVKFR